MSKGTKRQRREPRQRRRQSESHSDAHANGIIGNAPHSSGLVTPPGTESTVDKYLDFAPNRNNQININYMSPLNVGSLPNVITSDHVVNSIIKNGAKTFLPKSIQSNSYTP